MHIASRGTLTDDDDERLNGLLTAGDIAATLPDKCVELLLAMVRSLFRMSLSGGCEPCFDGKGELMSQGIESVDFQPLSDRVLVIRDSNTKTAGGVLLPDSQKKKVTRGVVVAVGPGKVTNTGERLPMNVKVGDRVLFGHFAAYECSINGKEYLVMSQDDILGIDKTGTSTVL